ncbi:MAG: SusD/RagB family nutrient-binding outer membrane lipoprotein [bacterium]
MKTYNIIKRISIKLLLPLFAIGVVLTSCDIDNSINQSPNAINQEKVKSVDGVYGLTIALQVAAADFYSSDRSRINSFFVWQMCSPPGLGRPQPVEWNSYNLKEDGPPDDVWKLTGYRGVKITTDIISWAPDVFASDALAGTRNTILGMAKTYRAIFFAEMAAIYGSIPIVINGLEPPEFATQREAYDEAQSLLDEALTHFASAGEYERDLNFGGDGTKWIEVVHTLKARYHLHMGEYAEALTEANLGISSAANTLFGIHTSSAGEYSPWGHWTLTETGEPLRCDANFMRLLNSEAGDNRITEYFLPNGDGEYWGFAVSNRTYNPAPDPKEEDNSLTCHLLKYGGYGDYFPAASYEENVLIRAECKARGTDLPGAVNDVNIIRLNAGLTDFSSTDKDAVIAEVLKQKYLELFLEGQAYHDMRRTGTLPATGIPYRWIYPTSEKNANPNYSTVEGHDAPGDPELVKWILNKKYGGELD